MNDRERSWDGYYHETDPEKRKLILDELYDQNDPCDEFRRQLYMDRYVDPKHPNEKRDLWLFKCVYFPGLYSKRNFLSKSLKKEMSAAVSELHLDHPEELSEEMQHILYREFRNTAARYIMACRGARYGSSLFGLKKATPEGRLKKLGHEIWVMSKGLAQSADMEQQMSIWCRAFYDELLEQEPSCQEYYK